MALDGFGNGSGGKEAGSYSFCHRDARLGKLRR